MSNFNLLSQSLFSPVWFYLDPPCLSESGSEPLNVNICFCISMLSAQALYEAGVKRKGTDVSTWISIMSQRSIPHLQKGEEVPTPDDADLHF